MGYRVAVVGATGNVGREMLKTLAEREFPVRRGRRARLRPLGRAGGLLRRETVLKVQALESFDFRGYRHRPASRPAPRSRRCMRRAPPAAGLRRHRQHLAFPHGPGRAAGRARGQSRRRSPATRKRNIIANPNCSTIQMVVALKPLHDIARIKRVVVATYQSVSGAGQGGDGRAVQPDPRDLRERPGRAGAFTKQIAFNVIPHIDVFMEDGATKEEWKMAVETRKILDPDIAVIATCVRVPVFIGHAEAVNVEFESADHRGAGARRAARGAGRAARRSPRGRGLRHPGRMRRRGRGLCQPHPRATRRCRTAWLLGRLRQSAQGRGAERGADRRSAAEQGLVKPRAEIKSGRRYPLARAGHRLRSNSPKKAG